MLPVAFGSKGSTSAGHNLQKAARSGNPEAPAFRHLSTGYDVFVSVAERYTHGPSRASKRCRLRHHVLKVSLQTASDWFPERALNLTFRHTYADANQAWPK